MLRRTLTIIALFVGTTATVVVAKGIASARAGSGRLPPIGQRKYVVESEDPSAPVTIQNAKAHPTKKYLKDPVQPSKDAKVIRPVKPKPAPKPVKQVARAGQLRFEKLPVNGHLRQPRVQFSRDVLPVGRADEPLSGDFFEKVFEPAKDDGF